MSEIVNCKALYPYSGAGGDQITTLDFDAGDLIKVSFSGEGGWWEGERNGHRGWFPASYVRKIEGSDTASVSSESWKEVTTTDGEIYYVNTETNESSWELPKPIEMSSDADCDDDVLKPIENSANTSTNNGKVVNGNSFHLPLPLLEYEHSLHTQSQPTTPMPKLSGPTTPESRSAPMTPKEKSSPVTPRAKSSTPTSPNQPNGQPARPRIRMVNGISFPDEKEAKEQTLLHPGKFSYCDYFWNDKMENHSFQSGFCILYQKMLKGKHLCKEVADYFKAREMLEIQYAKGLAALSNSVLAAQEGGTLGDTVKQVKAATLLESKIHQDFANKLRNEIEQPLLEQKEKEKKDLKKLEASMADLRKQVQLKYQAAERSKQMLLERTKDFEMKRTSTKHTKDEVQKARKKSTKQAEELKSSIESYNHIRQQWFEEMVTSSLVLERHESSRVKSVRALLSRYTNILQETNNKCHKTCDAVNQNIAVTDADKDRELWVRKNATGKVKPVDLVI
ncbi:unnamed protein product [Clavelina lepadiformis]|uniref:Growth arrest-specific protein 7 n=1 Tax=Clavelina lepadiformis TaxID=159417 RepID=A0ABP0FWE8_CLALP